ncbi:hypothetical protein EDF46_3065 [Frondihabitans sp. PhB188]|uniref:chemotaxis protein CheY n=1 Tax=Frondihabitans sp. PhB188 TaxID=2485200 RepID=UPI000F467089|nr:chemotaxis protein CheY [Frondihabitans sp. PhB188]ROQ36523.1 hypothetical protein EDF46_3065 [Frondihabitans sp. PhB188]
MTDRTDITPAAARRLLSHADSLSRRTHDAVRWPYIAFLLGLGSTTSFGTAAMTLTEGRAFGLVYVGTLAATFALLLFFLVTTQGRRAFAWSRRWTVYMACWSTAYAGAIAAVALAHGSVAWAGTTSGLVLLVTLVCAAVEARR